MQSLQILIANFPVWIIFLLVTVCVIAIGLLIHIAVLNYTPNSVIRFFPDSNAHYLIISSSATVLIAFVIIMLWQNLQNAKFNVQEEVNALSQIVIGSKSLPLQAQQQINNAVKQYSSLVIDKEWPLMAVGKKSPETERAFENIYTTIMNYTPRGEIETIFYHDLLTDCGVAYSRRHARIDQIGSIIPTSLFYILLFTMLLIIVSVSLVTPKTEKKSNIILLIIMFMMIGIDISLIMSFDFPYSGEISIKSTPFSEILGPELN